MEEVNKDKRLIKKTQLLAALIHPPPREDPGGPRRLDRPPKKLPGPEPICLLSVPLEGALEGRMS